jgi:hypothetical protein
MKRFMMVCVLASAAFVANAQQKDANDNYPYWTISKAVQRVQYQDVVHTPATVTVTDVATTVSKDVKRSESFGSSTVVVTGKRPSSSLKGVAAMRASKNSI